MPPPTKGVEVPPPLPTVAGVDVASMGVGVAAPLGVASRGSEGVGDEEGVVFSTRAVGDTLGVC